MVGSFYCYAVTMIDWRADPRAAVTVYLVPMVQPVVRAVVVPTGPSVMATCSPGVSVREEQVSWTVSPEVTATMPAVPEEHVGVGTLDPEASTVPPRVMVMVPVMVEDPEFFTVMEKEFMVPVAVPPAAWTWTTPRKELVVAEPARLKTAAVTIPPTARTAAMMMKRSRL